MEGIGTVEVAQGHNSAMVDDDGKMYLVYHTRFQSDSGTNEGHQIRVHQIFENDNGWLVAAPYEYSGAVSYTHLIIPESYRQGKSGGKGGEIERRESFFHDHTFRGDPQNAGYDENVFYEWHGRYGYV